MGTQSWVLGRDAPLIIETFGMWIYHLTLVQNPHDFPRNVDPPCSLDNKSQFSAKFNNDKYCQNLWFTQFGGENRQLIPKAKKYPFLWHIP